MRVSKQIKVGDNDSITITVKELHMEKILPLLKEYEENEKKKQLAKENSKSVENQIFTKQISTIFNEMLGMDEQSLTKLSGSDMKRIWDTVKEVNKDFFEMLREMKILPIVEKILEMAMQNFLTSFQQVLSFSFRKAI